MALRLVRERDEDSNRDGEEEDSGTAPRLVGGCAGDRNRGGEAGDSAMALDLAFVVLYGVGR